MHRFIPFLVCSFMAISSAYASSGIGLKTRRVGKNILLVDPKIVKLPNEFVKVWEAREKPAPRVVAPLAGPDDLHDFEETFSSSVKARLGPGAYIVRHYSSGTGSFGPMPSIPDPTLCPETVKALKLAPTWIQVEMIGNLAALPCARQEALAKLMTEVEDPRYLDELAFMLANITPEDLSNDYLKPRYLLDQVKFLYQADAMLDYVELKDVGDPTAGGDYYTTAVYTYTDNGVVKTWEAPREYYYWWVLSPRLDAEELYDIRPDTGKYAGYPLALTFREYFLFPPKETAQYTTHYIFKIPPPFEKDREDFVEIPYDELNGWGPSQRGAFTQYVVGPTELTRDSQGRLTTIEFKVRPKGIVLATTLLVEEAYATGKSKLLANMLRYGPGNVVQDGTHKHVVVMERAPFGHAGLIEAILKKFKVNFEVVDSSWLYDSDYADVRKIVIPSDQPLAVYKAVAENREKLEAWLGAEWRIFELHGAVSSPEDDWSGLVMPGGFSAEGVADEGDDFVEVEGQPPLDRLIAGTKYVWDGLKYPGLSGDRIFDLDTFALDKIGWWASQNVFDSVADWTEKHPWLPGPERADQANRVLYNHFGNCGENQDIITAASRSVLIPTANTSNGCEDHVWSEFYFLDDWHPFQIQWADGPTDIDAPEISASKKFGGGKNNSLVTQTRMDGASLNRTDYYHFTGKLTLKVVDGQGYPIRGATVLFASESYYLDPQTGSYPLMIGHWDVTDAEGKLVVELGANIEDPISNCKKDLELRCNNYYVKVVTKLGNFPPGEGEIMLVVEDVEAVKGFEKKVTIQLDDVPGKLRPKGTVEPGELDQDVVLHIRLEDVEELSCGVSLYTGTYCDPSGEGILDFYLLDHEGFMKMISGEKFDALAVEEGVSPGFDFVTFAPVAADWYAVFVNNHNFQHFQVGDITFQKLERLAGPPEEASVADVSSEIEPDVWQADARAADAGPQEGSGWTEDSQEKKDSGCSAARLGRRANVSWSLVVLLLFTCGLFAAARLAWARCYRRAPRSM